MTTTGRGDFDLGGSLRAMPNFGNLRNRFLPILGAILVLILLFASTTSIPTGNVGVLTLFGRVTGDVLGEGIHLIERKSHDLLSAAPADRGGRTTPLSSRDTLPLEPDRCAGGRRLSPGGNSEIDSRNIAPGTGL